MAIRGKHILDEIKIAEEATVNASVVEKVIIKLITLVLRVLLTIRLNQVKIMEKLGQIAITPQQKGLKGIYEKFGVEKIQPRLPIKDEVGKVDLVKDVEEK